MHKIIVNLIHLHLVVLNLMKINVILKDWVKKVVLWTNVHGKMINVNVMMKVLRKKIVFKLMNLKNVIPFIIVYIFRNKIYVDGNNVKINPIMIVKVIIWIKTFVIKIHFNNVNLLNNVKMFKIQFQNN